MINFHIVVARINHPESRNVDFFIDLFFDDGIGVLIATIDDFHRQKKFARVAVVMSARSGQIAVVRETWIFVRGATNCVIERFATLAVIAECSRSQMISCRVSGAERGSVAPSRISSYGLAHFPKQTSDWP